MRVQTRAFNEADVERLLCMLRRVPDSLVRRRIGETLMTARRAQLAAGPVRWVELLPPEADALWRDVMELRHFFPVEERRALERLLPPLALMKEGLYRTNS
jgi:hypothetical protein